MDWIGGATVVRREVFENIGLFDENYGIFYEDTDLCYRARKKGYRVIYVPEAKLWHRTTSTITNTLSVKQKDYLGQRSRIRFIVIHFTLQRMLATFLVDLVAWFLVDSGWKKALLKAYRWNFMNLGTTLNRRLEIGPSPPLGMQVSRLFLGASSLSKRVHRIGDNAGPSAFGRKLRVGVYCPTFNVYGGAEAVTAAIADTLAKDNYDVTLFTNEEINQREIANFFGKGLNSS